MVGEETKLVFRGGKVADIKFGDTATELVFRLDSYGTRTIPDEIEAYYKDTELVVSAFSADEVTIKFTNELYEELGENENHNIEIFLIFKEVIAVGDGSGFEDEFALDFSGVAKVRVNKSLEGIDEINSSYEPPVKTEEELGEEKKYREDISETVDELLDSGYNLR